MNINKPDRRKMVTAVIVAILFTAMQITGYQISMYYGTTVHRSPFFQKLGVLSSEQCLLAACIAFPFWSIVLYGLYSMLDRVKARDRCISSKKSLWIWFGSAVVLFISWIPCFLACYPGFYTYDAMVQTPQALYAEVPYSAHHPLLHTFLMGKIIAFGYHRGVDLNDGIAFHSICQMLFCAGALGYIVSYILRISKKYWLAVAALCYYAVFPVIAMFAMCTTKDVIFSVLLQLAIIFMYEMCRDMQQFYADKWRLCCFIITTVLMCLFRKNGIYIVVGIVPFVILFFKKYAKRCLCLFGGIIVIYLLISKSLFWILEAEEGSIEEAFSVPIQQIARVYNEYGENAFTEEEIALIYDGISPAALMNYNPLISDDIKNIFDFDVVLEQEGDYLKLWIRKGLQYPTEYIRAFLDNTYQAWYPGTSVDESPGDGQTYYFAMHMCAGGYRDSRWPELLKFYDKIAAGYDYYQKIPVVRLLFSIGAMFWVMLFSFGYGMYKKDKALIVAILMAMLCCGTVLLGPVSLVRYYLVLFYGFPVCVAFMTR